MDETQLNKSEVLNAIDILTKTLDLNPKNARTVPEVYTRHKLALDVLNSLKHMLRLE